LRFSAAIERALPIEARELRPDWKEDNMSSEINTANLKSKDLKMLQEVLVSCGYKGKISANPEGEFIVAARLIIKLFHRGLREPVQLANALRRNFGSSQKGANVINFSGPHRDAVPGVTPPGRRVH
jgi:hypothetical protein